MGLYDDLEPTEAERKLIEAAAKGEFCDLSAGDDEKDNPKKNGAKWGAERTIRAQVIVALATGARDEWEVAAKGIQLFGAKIEETLDFREETVTRPLIFGRCYFGKVITFHNARTRSIYIVNSHIQVSEGPAIRGDSLRCAGALFLKGTSVDGVIRLLGAHISGNLEMDGASLEGTVVKGQRDVAFHADGLTTKGDVFMRKGFSAKGEVRLLGAHIDGNLDMDGAALNNSNGAAFHGQGMIVKGVLTVRDLKPAPVGHMDLTHAIVGQLIDDPMSWPSKGNLWINGFQYGALAGDPTPTDWVSRLKWLDRMPKRKWVDDKPKDEFWPQPYEQLIEVLRRMGHETDAREIAVAKQDAYLERGNLSFRHRFWLKFIRVTIGYGYKPWRAGWWIAGVILFGALIFQIAFFNDVMHPSKERVYMHDCYLDADRHCDGWRTVELSSAGKELHLPSDYTDFNAIIYAADTFLPFFDFHQETSWLPTESGWWFLSFRGYLWFHIAFGWFLSTIAIVGLTGILKKD